MGVHLTDYICIDIKQLAHPIKWKVAGHTTVNELKITPQPGHVVRLDLAVFGFDHELDGLEDVGDGTARQHRRPHHNFWWCKIIQKFRISLAHSIGHSDVEVPLILFVNFKEGNILGEAVAHVFEGALVKKQLPFSQFIDGIENTVESRIEEMSCDYFVVSIEDFPEVGVLMGANAGSY